MLVRTEAELAGSSFPRLALEMALLRLAHLPSGRDVATLVRQVEDLQRRLESGVPPAERAQPASYASSESIVAERPAPVPVQAQVPEPA